MATLVAVTSLITACGGDGEDDTAAASTNPPPSNTPPPSSSPPNKAPTIGGTPPATVLQGALYDFTPTATDGDGDVLTFSIAGKPAWATFNQATGRLRGTPGQADLGTYSNITITVTDGLASASLGPFAINVMPTATGSATLSWTPPTQNTDGSPLTNLAGYKIYWGTTQGVYPNSVTVNNPGLTTYVVEPLTPATWYFVATAINSNGVESAFSSVVSKTVL